MHFKRFFIIFSLVFSSLLLSISCKAIQYPSNGFNSSGNLDYKIISNSNPLTVDKENFVNFTASFLMNLGFTIEDSNQYYMKISKPDGALMAAWMSAWDKSDGVSRYTMNFVKNDTGLIISVKGSASKQQYMLNLLYSIIINYNE